MFSKQGNLLYWLLYHGIYTLLPGCILLLFSSGLRGQPKDPVDTATSLTLEQCIAYAFKNQPALNQAMLNEKIVKLTNDINLSAWYPQIYGNASVTHYLKLPESYVSNTSNPGSAPVLTTSGVKNSVVPSLSVTQNIFSPSLVYAAKSAPLYIKQAQQATDTSKINLVAVVSKAFYALLLTLKQIETLKEDTVRLSRSLYDAYHQYVGGIVDETDYQQANITLNNSRASLRQAYENIRPQYAILKQFMGFDSKNDFNVIFDTTRMKEELAFDTAQQLDFEKRIDYQLLQTTKQLQEQTVKYYKWAWLPTLSGSFSYDLSFINNSTSQLFKAAYPYSYTGLTMSIPIFTGFSRIKNLQRARLQEKVIDWDAVNLKLQIYTDYTTALASYNGNLYNMQVLRENVEMARRVYFVVDLQYKQGIVAYLNVITAEANLISSEINYINALFQVLSSKIDLKKAMGILY